MRYHIFHYPSKDLVVDITNTKFKNALDTFHYTTKDLVFDIKVDSIDTKLLDDVLPFSCCIFCTFSFFPKFWSSLHIILLNSFCILVSQTWKSDFETKPPFLHSQLDCSNIHIAKNNFPLEMLQMTTFEMPQMTTLEIFQMKTWQSVFYQV